MHVQAVVFDLDGTLIKTSVAFQPFRARIGCAEPDVLEYIGRQDAETRRRMLAVLSEYEACIQNDCTLNDGFVDLMAYLARHDIKTGIITRSSAEHARVVTAKMAIPIDTVIGRDTTTPKPAADALVLMGKLLSVPLDSMLFVGDFMWDVLAGRNAGVRTALLVKGDAPTYAAQADYLITSLREIVDIIEKECRSG
jgi:HAD superfamily hydrolase (TIGR01509 family)